MRRVPRDVRCGWAAGANPAMTAYHDTEWGVPLHDDRGLFEFLVLEGAQAGLSWATILRRRDGYRRALADFDIEAVAAFDDADIARLMADPGIIRNRAKIVSAIANARAARALVAEHGSLDRFLWGVVGGAPIQNAWASLAEIPASTPTSGTLSRVLRGRGFTFVGPTIAYAFMQAVGMVNDHEVGCFRYAELAGREGADRMSAR